MGENGSDLGRRLEHYRSPKAARMVAEVSGPKPERFHRRDSVATTSLDHVAPTPGGTADKAAHRQRSAAFLGAIPEAADRHRFGRLLHDIEHVAPVMQRKGLRRDHDKLQQKSTNKTISHEELRELSTLRNQLTADTSTTVMRDKRDKRETGIHEWTARHYYGTTTTKALGMDTAIHTTSNPDSAGYIREGINPSVGVDSGRMAGGYYVADSRKTSREEMAAHDFPRHEELSYQTTGRAKLLDLTHPVDQGVVKDRTRAEQELNGDPNRGKMWKKAAIDLGAGGAAYRSVRNAGGINATFYEKSAADSDFGITQEHRGTTTNVYSDEDRAHEATRIAATKRTPQDKRADVMRQLQASTSAITDSAAAKLVRPGTEEHRAKSAAFLKSIARRHGEH